MPLLGASCATPAQVTLRSLPCGHTLCRWCPTCLRASTCRPSMRSSLLSGQTTRSGRRRRPRRGDRSRSPHDEASIPRHLVHSPLHASAGRLEARCRLRGSRVPARAGHTARQLFSCGPDMRRTVYALATPLPAPRPAPLRPPCPTPPRAPPPCPAPPRAPPPPSSLRRAARRRRCERGTPGAVPCAEGMAALASAASADASYRAYGPGPTTRTTHGRRCGARVPCAALARIGWRSFGRRRSAAASNGHGIAPCAAALRAPRGRSARPARVLTHDDWTRYAHCTPPFSCRLMRSRFTTTRFLYRPIQ